MLTAKERIMSLCHYLNPLSHSIDGRQQCLRLV